VKLHFKKPKANLKLLVELIPQKAGSYFLYLKYFSIYFLALRC